MLYELKLNQYILKQPLYKSRIINQVINEKDKDPYKQFYPYVNINHSLLTPYHYLKNKKNKSIYYFIIIELLNKYSITNPSILFSNSHLYITCLYEMFSNIEFITKNKLCPYKKSIIYNYSQFIKTYKNVHETIIVHYEDYKTFIINLFIVLFIQKDKGTLIFNIPSTEGERHLNILHFLMYYYNVKIIKPFATNVYTNERYIICTNYNKNINPIFIKYIEYNINAMQSIEMPYLQSNKMSYYYLKIIIQENTIWTTYVLNILSKFLINNDIEYTDEQNKIAIEKWYSDNIT